MKSTLQGVLCVMALVSLLSFLAPAQQPQTSDSSAARRVNEWIAVVNSGDRKAARAYVEQNYTASALGRVPAGARVNTISGLYDETRGFELQSLRETKPNEVTALLRSKLMGEWWELRMVFEPQAPRGIERSGAGITPAPPASGQSTRALADEEKVRELDAFMQKVNDAGLFSGAVLLARDGRILFGKAYGEANKDFRAPNRVDTKFNLGSMNKMFTAVAIAQLAEAGKLSFDDPLAKFLPEFPNKEAAEKIKIKHLLTHTSGLGSYFNERFIESSRERFRTVDEFMELAKGETPAFEPGARRQYSNTGFLVLGKIIERVTGQSYFDYVRANIIKRAGMTNTDYYDLDRVNPNLAVGYDKEYTDTGVSFRNNIFQHVIRGGPAGGGYSTVEDLMRFAAALRSGKLVGEQYVQTLLTPKPELNSPTYGYGFSVNVKRGIAGHNGGFNGVSANLDVFLDKGYTCVVLSNYTDAAERVVIKMRELVSAGDGARAASAR